MNKEHEQIIYALQGEQDPAPTLSQSEKQLRPASNYTLYLELMGVFLLMPGFVILLGILKSLGNIGH